MTARRLREEHVALLREVLETRAPSLLTKLLRKAETRTLERDERSQLCELVGAEFADTGLGVDSEPTPRGEKLEQLLDELNRPNLSQ